MSKIRVLAADDDAANLSLLVKALGRAGMEVLVADDASELMALLRRDAESFDAVLLDASGPEGALKVLRRIKANARLRHLPVILQTASEDPEEVREGMDAGAYYYLTRPLTQRKVVAMVKAAAQDVARHRVLHAEVQRSGAPLAMMTRGSFRFRTLLECHELTNLLAKLCPEPGRTVTGLSELLVNALEHGNLGITYEEKGRLLDRNAWRAEVNRRQALPGNQDKWVEVEFLRLEDRIRFDVKDHGAGFDWRAFLRPSPARLFDNHGRGILMARMDSFDQLEYLGSGSHVRAEVLLRQP